MSASGPGVLGERDGLVGGPVGELVDQMRLVGPDVFHDGFCVAGAWKWMVSSGPSSALPACVRATTPRPCCSLRAGLYTFPGAGPSTGCGGCELVGGGAVAAEWVWAAAGPVVFGAATVVVRSLAYLVRERARTRAMTSILSHLGGRSGSVEVVDRDGEISWVARYGDRESS